MLERARVGVTDHLLWLPKLFKWHPRCLTTVSLCDDAMSHPAAVVSCAGQVTRHVSCPQTNARPIKFKVMSITNFRFLLWYQLNWTSLHVVYCRLRTAPPRSPLGVLPRFSCKKPKLFFFCLSNKMLKCDYGTASLLLSSHHFLLIRIQEPGKQTHTRSDEINVLFSVFF